MNYDLNTGTVTFTVRELTDFVCRSGDIGGGFGVSAEDGVLTHKRLEDESGPECMTEVPLEYEFERSGVIYRLSGRADGIWLADDGSDDVIEEIKTVKGAFWGGADRIPPAHIAQGVLYAFMWCARQCRDRATVRITYAPADEGKTRSFECPFSYSELRAEAGALIKKYAVWLDFFARRERERDAEIKRLKFPFSDVREGQRDFMAQVVKSARLGTRALIQAPTGIGKTMASVFPSVKSVGAGYIDRIFYLTQKSSTGEAAEAAMERLLPYMPSFRSITVTARDRVCPYGEKLYPTSSCSPDLCERAAGHYDRANAALWELIGGVGEGHHITQADIIECASRHKVCPYELSLDAAELCELIVCDCNYVFDPKVYFRRFFENTDDNKHKTEKYSFLCDEAHNLVDRACGMFSAELKMSSVDAVITLLRAENETDCADIIEALSAVKNEILKIKTYAAENITEDADGKERGYYISSEPFSGLCRVSEEASDFLRRLLRDKRGEESRRRELLKISRAYTELSDFAASSEHFDKRHIAFAEILGGDIKCLHLCLDASVHIDKRLSRAKTTVFFSATLEPPDYFCRVLGCEKNCDILELPSPYDSENLCLIAADKISTRLPDRETTAGEICSMIYDVASARVGNYICYLSSYKYVKLLSDAFKSRYGRENIDIVVQDRGMRESERESFISQFSPRPARSKVAFCVLGGLFSEGVDLPGDRLSGVIVVGVGLPQISAELNLRRDHFEAISERGHEFAYMFPGMNKVLQAAGRVIRGEDDCGVVLLIDDRFGGGDYRAVFPSHWSHLRYIGSERSLSRVLFDFWRKMDEKRRK